jgi:hypothetical protein
MNGVVSNCAKALLLYVVYCRIRASYWLVLLSHLFDFFLHKY